MAQTAASHAAFADNFEASDPEKKVVVLFATCASCTFCFRRHHRMISNHCHARCLSHFLSSSATKTCGKRLHVHCCGSLGFFCGGLAIRFVCACSQLRDIRFAYVLQGGVCELAAWLEAKEGFLFRGSMYRSASSDNMRRCFVFAKTCGPHGYLRVWQGVRSNDVLLRPRCYNTRGKPLVVADFLSIHCALLCGQWGGGWHHQICVGA